MVAALLVATALAAPSLEADLRAVAALPGEPSVVAAAGLTPDDMPVLTLGHGSALDAASKKRHAVIVGSDETTAGAVIDMVRWFKRDAPRQLRDQWMVSALPFAAFGAADTKSLARWMTFQAADVVVEIVND